ncbi:MAG: hypothetical protein K2I70_04300 [Bacilli bacterium]|nr:hypothetical protein [Bacilli bacterium]
MKEYIPTLDENNVIDKTNKTTLVIDEVPSDLAYEILVEALNRGNALNHDELVSEIKARTKGEEMIIHYDEAQYIMHEIVHVVCKDCLAREEDFKEEDNDRELYEDPDYIQEVIERAKEGMRIKHREGNLPEPTPTPPPSFHR